MLAGKLHQILTVLLQGVVGILRVIGGHPLVAAHGGKLLQKGVFFQVEGAEQLTGGLILLVQQAKEQVLHADEVILHGLGLAGGGAEHLIGGLRDIDLIGVTTGAGHPGQCGKLFRHGGGKAAGVNVQLLQQLGDQAVFLRSQCVQQMGGFQCVVLVLHSQLLGCLQSLKGLLRILIGIHKVKPPFIPEGLF